MARIMIAPGSCPVCGEDITRTLHLIDGTGHEVYHCPRDGRLAYGTDDVPLARWAPTRPAAPVLAH